jgi:CBS domain-containing protein
MASKDDHTCRSMMTTKPVVIKETETVAKAMRMLLDNRLLGLPVVDDNDHYRGMFLRSRLVALLLPTIVQLEERLPEVGRLLELGFMTDTLDDAHDRFQKVARDTVSKYVQTDTPILRLDTPVMNAVLYLYRTRSYLPVVDEASGKLLGVVSTWDVLARIAGSSR